MRNRTLLLAALVTLTAACTSEAPAEADSEDALVGGRSDATFAAGGFLRVDGESRVACGATLLAPKVVVTAAHCVSGKEPSTLAFGVGDADRVRAHAREIHVHPSFHPEAVGHVDLRHALRMFDVAYVVLDREVTGVRPAALPDAAPAWGADVRAIGYRASAKGAAPRRVGAPARIILTVDLGGDPIMEVHPRDGSALCVADGDEGSAVFGGTDAAPVLVGLYVGSVTQGVTDCVRGSQYLDGYESAYGYRAFFAEAVAAGRR